MRLNHTDLRHPDQHNQFSLPLAGGSDAVAAGEGKTKSSGRSQLSIPEQRRNRSFNLAFQRSQNRSASQLHPHTFAASQELDWAPCYFQDVKERTFGYPCETQVPKAKPHPLRAPHAAYEPHRRETELRPAIAVWLRGQQQCWRAYTRVLLRSPWSMRYVAGRSVHDWDCSSAGLLTPLAPVAKQPALSRKRQGHREFSQRVEWLFRDTHCCLLYTSPSPRDRTRSRMPSSA